MSQADEIRNFVIEHWINPARAERRNTVTIRAGDVHKRMNLSNAYPAVCSALGSKLLADAARVPLPSRTGVANGANSEFTFQIGRSAALDSQSRNAIDRAALAKLRDQFLARHPDFLKFLFDSNQGSYWENERAYKQTLIDKAHAAIEQDNPSSDAVVGAALLDILTSKPSNLLGWRMQGRLSNFREQHPDAIESGIGKMVRASEPPDEAVGLFVNALWPLYSEPYVGNMPYADFRAFPTMALALAKPAAAFPVRHQIINAAGTLLLHRPLFKNQKLSAEEYGDVLDMATQIYAVMRDDWGWKPRDLWDVQGFLWTACSKKYSADDTGDAVEDDEAMGTSRKATNLILYGPPGTGKTFSTIAEAVRLCDGSVSNDWKELKARYDELRVRNRIEFVTFHQSYSYEDFVEGLRPDTDRDDGSEKSAGFKLTPHPGILLNIADRAASNKGKTDKPVQDFSAHQAFKMSLGRSFSDDEDYLFEEAIKGGYVLLGYGGNVDWSDAKYDDFAAIKARWQQDFPEASGNDPNIQQIFALRSYMQLNDLVIISDGNKRFRAVGEIIGPYRFAARERDTYHHQRSVRWLWVEREGLPREEIYEKQFSQVSIYRLNSEHLKWPALSQIIAGGMAQANPSEPEPYVLVIDEINRANISKVFGEAITLVEPDKRVGAENALTVTLPYSGRTFGLPQNLHVLGTMNTADRSIALLDTALRRRFDFRELMPDVTRLSENVEGVNVRSCLLGINKRIQYLFDRDHQIGHAYLMGIESRAELDAAMRGKVIPLLVEYFYESWEKVRAVLNESKNAGAFVKRTELSRPSGLDDGTTEDTRWDYTINVEFPSDAYDQLA